MLDLAVANRVSEDVSVVLGPLANGTYHAATSLPLGAQLTGISSGDLDGDGALDLVVADAKGTVWVLKGNGDGTFQTSRYAAGQNAQALALGDLNGDGRPDVVVASAPATPVPAFVSVLLAR